MAEAEIPKTAICTLFGLFEYLFMPFGLKNAAQTQRWAKGPIDRFSDTDSIFRLYRTIQSVDAKFRFLNRPIVSVRFEFRFFDRLILFLGLKFRFLYRPIVSVRFEFRFLNRPILFFGFKFRFLYRAIVTNAVKMVGNGLAGPSKMDFVETIRLLYVRFCNFEG